jgi:lipoprotein signal peptidase
VAVAVVVPAAAVHVTFTPVCQLVVFNVTDVGVQEIAVLPDRVNVTATFPEGAALSRMFDVPLAPLASVSDVGLATIVGVTVP